MAHHLRISALSDELVQLITQYTPEPKTNARALRAAKDTTARALRHHRFGRTNQFAVQASLTGLSEKCRVVGNDPLAEALDARVAELDLDDKHTPELLELLLLLADRPAEKASVSSLDALRPPTPPPPITWDDIFRDEPRRDEPFWEDVDYGGSISDGSDRDDSFAFSEDAVARKSREASPSTDVEMGGFAAAQALVVPVDDGVLDSIIECQDWRDEEPPLEQIDELHVMREMLFMLRGLPTTLFPEIGSGEVAAPGNEFRLRECSGSAVDGVLSEAVDIGNVVRRLKKFLGRLHRDTAIQRFAALCAKHVEAFEHEVAGVESRFVDIKQPQAVSLLDVVSEIKRLVRPLELLEDLLRNGSTTFQKGSHYLLDLLFEQAEIRQLMQDDCSELFKKLLMDTLDVYLRPVEAWMENGQLLARDRHFCVASNDTDAELRDFWTSRFEINVQDGEPCAPSFLQPYLDDILDAGKTVAFIRGMGFSPPTQPALEDRPSQTSATGTIDDSTSMLIPFSDTLSKYLSHRLEQSQTPSWPRLHSLLLHDTGLLSTISALNTIYLSADGLTFLAFADPLLSILAASPHAWRDDPLPLESLARSSFSQTPSVDPRRLSLSLSSQETASETANPLLGRSVSSLNALHLTYTPPAPLLNILSPASQKAYQSALTLLLQLRRSLAALAPAISRPAAPSSDSLARLVATGAAHAALRHALLHALGALHHHASHALAGARKALDSTIRHADGVPALRNAHARFVRRVRAATLQDARLRVAREALVALCDVAVLVGEGAGGESAAHVPGEMPPAAAASPGRMRASVGSAGGNAASGVGNVALGRRREERVRGLRGQVLRLRGAVVGELRRCAVEGGDDDADGATERERAEERELFGALAETLDVGVGRTAKGRRTG